MTEKETKVRDFEEIIKMQKNAEISYTEQIATLQKQANDLQERLKESNMVVSNNQQVSSITCVCRHSHILIVRVSASL